MTTVVYIENTNVVEIRGVQNAVTEAYVNDATVTVTIKDADGVAVTGETWPKAMTYIGGSDGDYRAVLSYLMDLERGTYRAFIDVVDGSNRGHWEYPFKAKTRTTE